MEHFTIDCKMLLALLIVNSSVYAGQWIPQNTASSSFGSVHFLCNTDHNNNTDWYIMENGTWITIVEEGLLHMEYWDTFSYYPYARLDIKAEAIHKNIWKQYACAPNVLAPTKHAAQLIVIDEIPNCPESEQTAIAEEPYQINCSLGFSGLWAPEIKWIDSRGNPITGTNHTTADLANYWAEFIPTPEDDGKELTCSATMPPPPDGVLPHDDAHTIHSRNAPPYSAQLCTVTLNLIYGPQIPTIGGPGNEAEIGDSFPCDSDSKPAA